MTEPNDILFPDEQPELWAEIILPLALAVVYTYVVPPDLADRAKPGCRAEVVLGRIKNMRVSYAGYWGQKPSFPAKPILNVLDDEPIVGRGAIAVVGMDGPILYVYRRGGDGRCFASQFQTEQ